MGGITVSPTCAFPSANVIKVSGVFTGSGLSTTDTNFIVIFSSIKNPKYTTSSNQITITMQDGSGATIDSTSVSIPGLDPGTMQCKFNHYYLNLLSNYQKLIYELYFFIRYEEAVKTFHFRIEFRAINPRELV